MPSSRDKDKGPHVPTVLDLDAAAPRDYPTILARLVLGSDLALVVATTVEGAEDPWDAVLATNAREERLATLMLARPGQEPTALLLAVTETAERLYDHLLVRYPARAEFPDE